MSPLLWWAIFLVPTLLAVVRTLWQANPNRSDAFHSIAEHHRFVEALSRTVARSGRSGDRDR